MADEFTAALVVTLWFNITEYTHQFPQDRSKQVSITIDAGIFSKVFPKKTDKVGFPGKFCWGEHSLRHI